MSWNKRHIVENNLLQIKEWEKSGTPLMEVARNLNIKYDTLRKYLRLLNIGYKLNPHRRGLPHKEARVSIEDKLNSNSSNASKRRKLIEEGIKEAMCECCGLSEWMGKPIPLELHHKDFNHHNNSLDNLQILCANCHMQAHNYSNNNTVK